MVDNIYTGEDTRVRLMAGVNKVCDAVKITLGAAGGNGIIERGVNPGHEITNDGISIIEAVELADPIENIGANLVKENSSRSNRESGDGTTTAAVLLQAILREGMKYNDVSPMDMKRSLDECLPLINDAIDQQTREIKVEEVGAVASISAESEELGDLLQNIYKEIGKDGIVEIDNSGTYDTFYEIKEGVRLRNAGYMSPHMANDGVKAIYKRPKVLITKQKISTLQDIDPLFQALSSAGTTELVIFCDEIDASVYSALAFTHANGIFKTLIIKAPTLWKDWLFEDFAKITGATIVEPATGVSFRNLSSTHLGTCEKIISTREETTVIGIQDISAHIAALEAEGTDDAKLRLAWLKTKAAILRLGANSESELSYKRLKAEDARNASYVALKGGVVAGGGVALVNAARALPDTVGGLVLQAALKAPTMQIVENAGGTYVLDLIGGADGYDARTNQIVNMWEEQILDPALVVKNAVKNAISVASTVLTARIVVTMNKKV